MMAHLISHNSVLSVSVTWECIKVMGETALCNKSDCFFVHI